MRALYGERARELRVDSRMMAARPLLIGWVVSRLARLRFPRLFVITAALFALDLVVPDLIPFADEILFGLATALLGSWRRRKDEPKAAEEVDRNPQ
jgi:hypothetical protein